MLRLILLALTLTAFSPILIANARDLTTQCTEPASAPLAPAKVRSYLSALSAAKKGDYETTQQFQSRLSTLLNGFSGEIVASKTLEHDAGDYDADASQLTLSSSLLGAEFGYLSGLDSDYKSFQVNVAVIQQNKSKPSTYVGQNGFGARVSVHSQSISQVGLAFDKIGSLEDIPLGIGWEIHIPMAPAEAKLRRSHLVVQVQGVLKAPYVLHLKSFGSPTLDVPIDVTTSGTYLYFQASCIFVRDGSDGPVLASYELPNN